MEYLMRSSSMSWNSIQAVTSRGGARRAAGMWIFAFSADDGRRASLISKSILCYGRSLQQLG